MQTPACAGIHGPIPVAPRGQGTGCADRKRLLLLYNEESRPLSLAQESQVFWHTHDAPASELASMQE